MSTQKILPYVDGYYGPEREVTVIPSPQFPFRNNPTPDTYSRVYQRIFEASPRVFLPKIANRTSWSNLLTYSEDFTNAAWTKTNLNVAANQTTAPDGQLTMGSLVETTANAEHSVAQAATVTATASELMVFAKNGLSRSWIKVTFTDSASTAFSAFFNIDSGYIGTKSAGVTALVVPLGNGHFQCIMQFTPAAGTGTVKVNISTNGSTISYVGDATKGLYLWGAQIATGASAPYISTTTSRAVSAPNRDPVDPFAYLVEEDDPRLQNSETAQINRLYARIPQTQTVPDAIQVTKPTIPGTFPQTYGSFQVIQPDATKASFDVYLPQTVVADSGFSINVSGGTYTLTFGASTTGNIAFNAAAATVQSALNALTSIIGYGSVAVSGTYLVGFAVVFTPFAAATANAGSLTSTSGSTNITSVGTANSGFTQYITLSSISGNLTAASIAPGSLTDPASTAATATVTPDSNGHNQTVVIQAATLDNGNPSIVSSMGSVVTTVAFQGGSLFVTGGARFTFEIIAVNPSTALLSGTYTLTAYGQTTAAIPVGSSDATVLAAINAALTNLTARGSIVKFTSYFNPGGVPQATGFGTQLVIAFDFIPTGITGGTYTISIFGQTTAAIAYNATAAAIQTALNLLSNVTANGGVIVTGAYNSGSIVFTISFPSAAFTGGTYTLTIFGQTTAAIAYNASTSDIAAALNLLSTVIAHGKVTVTGAGWNGAGAISFVLNFTAATITGAAGSLTPSPGAITVTPTDTTGEQQSVLLTTKSTDRYLTIPNHGFATNASDLIMVNIGGVFTYGIGGWIYVDTNTIKVNASFAPFNVATLVTQCGKRTKAGYKPGLQLVRCSIVSSFYLVGVTSGINAVTDIPNPTFEGDSASLLAALFAGETAINYQVGQLTSWHGPVLQRTLTTLNAADL